VSLPLFRRTKMPKAVTLVDADVMHVPPSQQTCHGPVEKPGEPLRPEAESGVESEPKAAEAKAPPKTQGKK
jgi:hypothetical protein